MLFYVKCPSCSRTLSYNLDKYYADVQNILDDPTKKKAQKSELGAQLLIKYGYKMLCCRSRIMGLIPYHKIIVT